MLKQVMLMNLASMFAFEGIGPKLFAPENEVWSFFGEPPVNC